MKQGKRDFFVLTIRKRMQLNCTFSAVRHVGYINNLLHQKTWPKLEYFGGIRSIILLL